MATHGGAVDRLDVNRVIKRLAHAQILHRIAPLHIGIEQFIAEHVHRQEDGAHFRAFQHADILRLAQAIQILQGRVEHEINLTRQQRSDAGRIRRNRAEDDFRHIRLTAGFFLPTPPIIVADHHGAHIGLTRC